MSNVSKKEYQEEESQVNIARTLSIVVSSLCGMGVYLAATVPDKPITVRVATYNVEFSRSATPEQIGEMFKQYKLDLIGFNEAPDGDWTDRVGKVLGMKHSYVGKISSANHKDKYKTILSRTPLENTAEYRMKGRGWNPASVVKAVTKIEGIPIAFYSLHICASGKQDGHAFKLASEILPKETVDRFIVVGDFNNHIGDDAINTIEEAAMKPIWRDLNVDLSKKYTWNAFKPKGKWGVIDHIFYNVSSGAKAIDGGIIELKKPLSDHKPIWAQIVFPRDIENAKKPEHE